MKATDNNRPAVKHDDKIEPPFGWQDRQIYSGSRYSGEMLTFLLLIGPAERLHQAAPD